MVLASLIIWALMPVVPKPVTAPATIPDDMLMMAITASSSTKVNPRFHLLKECDRLLCICLTRNLTRMSVSLLPWAIQGHSLGTYLGRLVIFCAVGENRQSPGAGDIEDEKWANSEMRLWDYMLAKQ